MPELPLGLENVILKALEKSPSRRFQTCEALAAGLQAALRPTGNLGPSAPTQPARPMVVEDTHQHGHADETIKRTSTQLAKEPLRVVLADDHTLLRKTLASFLEARDEFVIVGEAGDGDGAVKQVLELMPDVLVLDLNMPGRGGLDVLPEIRAKAPSVKVLVLTGRDEDWYIMRALRAGANGYILKSSDESDLVEGIIKVVQGSVVLGHGVVEKVVSGLMGAVPGENSDKLNEKERQVLLYVAAGAENDVIAKRMNMQITDVVEMLAHSMDKLAARDRYTAALEAIKQGFILLEEVQEVKL